MQEGVWRWASGGEWLTLERAPRGRGWRGLALRCLIREDQVGLAGVRVALLVRSPCRRSARPGVV